MTTLAVSYQVKYREAKLKLETDAQLHDKMKVIYGKCSKLVTMLGELEDIECLDSESVVMHRISEQLEKARHVYENPVELEEVENKPEPEEEQPEEEKEENEGENEEEEGEAKEIETESETKETEGEGDIEGEDQKETDEEEKEGTEEEISAVEEKSEFDWYNWADAIQRDL